MTKMRYKAIEKSNHECCNGASVVDLTKPSEFIDDSFYQVCECYDMEIAQKIADALNRREPND